MPKRHFCNPFKSPFTCPTLHCCVCCNNKFPTMAKGQREAKTPGRFLDVWLLTKWTMAVIAIHSVLAGPTIKTGVTLTVIDDGITGFAWVHKTTQMKMDERRMTQANGEALFKHRNSEKPPGPFPASVTGAFHHSLSKTTQGELANLVNLEEILKKYRCKCGPVMKTLTHI